jgi:hypothetical protein
VTDAFFVGLDIALIQSKAKRRLRYLDHEEITVSVGRQSLNFNVHRDSLPLDSSFDPTSRPWLMLAANSGLDFVNLDNAAGLMVKSRNLNIAEFDEPQGSSNNATPELMVKGKSPGVTFIDVFAPGSSTTVNTKLEVSVKDKVSHTIAFHLVTDNLINKTTRTPQSVTILHNVLNDIYRIRANLNFNMTGSASIALVQAF